MKELNKEKKKFKNNKLQLSSPWVIYCTEVAIMFYEDSSVRVVYDEDNYILKIYVDNNEKADAISKLLPTEKTFGNVKLQIKVIPANVKKNIADLMKIAFNGNPIIENMGYEGDKFYVVFERAIVQYFNDNIFDKFRVKTTLYQDIANNIFDKHDGVFFCTDIE